jgi:DNA-binding NarL/FixJ family response regulator
MYAMLADEPNKAIARKLELGMRTIDRRRRAVLDKMGVSSATELAAILARSPLKGSSASHPIVPD